MDVNDLRSIITVACFLLFVGIVCWAWSGKRKADFDAAARLPLDDDQSLPSATGRHGNA
jgi:cytochrome c oxidase cbb3-type subunit 4